MTYRFKHGDSIWKRTWPQEAGIIIKQGTIGNNWPAYLVERPDGIWAMILEQDAQSLDEIKEEP